MTSYTYESIELGEDHALGCRCCRFSYGVDLPIPQKLSIDEIKEHANAFSSQIFRDWITLHAVIKRFERSIQKRWLRKSDQQRRGILLQAWPDMPTTHRPDFAGMRDLKKQAPRSRSCVSNAFLWPYINLEDLQTRHLLLVFLNSRGRSFPDVFASGDAEAAHFERSSEGWHEHVEGDESLMQFLCSRTPRTYADAKPRKGLDGKNAGAVYHAKFGLLVLEIQRGIYSFLLACTKLILHDISPAQYFTCPTLPEPELPKLNVQSWPSLSDHMLEMTYRAPEQLDLTRIKALVSARRAATEDHLWLLREDPGYFEDALKEWKDHDDGWLRHTCRCSWRAIACRMFSHGYSMFLFWNWIYCKLDRMTDIDVQIRLATKTPRAHLRKKDDLAWVELLDVVSVLTRLPLALITTGFPVSPRMRHCFNLNGKQPDLDNMWSTRRKIRPEESRVEILFYTLCNPNQHQLHSPSKTVNEIQYMLDTDPKASELVDGWVLEHFSDLALLYELNYRIKGFDPWSASWFATDLLNSDAVVGSNEKLLGLDVKIRDGFTKVFADGALINAAMGNPLDGMYDYPVTKRPTETSIKQMRLAESRLDAFWIVVDSGVETFVNIHPMKFLKKRLLEPREIYRTPEWVAPKVTPKKITSPLIERNINVADLSSSPFTPGLLQPIQTKIKVKTRGTPIAPDSAEECANDGPDVDGSTEQMPATRIKVPKRAYKVLSAFLPEPTAAHHQRTEVAWDDFLQAMSLIGFQPEKLYGSVWIFTPRSSAAELVKRGKQHKPNYPWQGTNTAPPKYLVTVKRSIQFHEPKEVRKGSKMPPHMVRTFGRRFKHAFGWEDAMFECE